MVHEQEEVPGRERLAHVGEHGLEGRPELLVHLRIASSLLQLVHSAPFDRRTDLETQFLLDAFGDSEVRVALAEMVALGGMASTGFR